MPKPTTFPPQPASPLDRATSLKPAAAPLIAGALLAAAELAGGLLLLPLFDLGRAEALIFFAFRPWLLLLAALAAAHWPLRRRAGLYAATLAVAAASETILVLALGAADPWAEMLRGLAMGILIAILVDVITQTLRRWHNWLGSLLAFLFLAAFIFFGSGTKPWEALVLGPSAPRAAAAPKPPLLLMTGLPIVWGTGGAFDPNSRPAGTYRALEREFEVTPLDSLSQAALRGRRLMLLAQPRMLAPEELVALDDWVRGGGRVLILTDPKLAAAERLPLLDVARPPDQGLLGPLLTHWGVSLEPGEEAFAFETLELDGRVRRLGLDSPGRFAVSGNSCRIAGEAWIARCRIGRGEALLVADADLLTDETWMLPEVGNGHERHLRAADNPLIVAAWLDSLEGRSRPRAERDVAWADPAADEGRASLLALTPNLLALLLGLALLLAARRKLTNLSTGMPTENNPRTDLPRDP